MDKEQLSTLKTWFDGFVADFYGDDPYINANLKLKEIHTLRVCSDAQWLAVQLGMSHSDRLIAEAIGLLHDVGRFPQFVKYKTYCDPRSTDHCQLGMDVLNQANVLGFLDGREREIIETSIKFHGAKQLPDKMDEETALFAKIIRDADKIDIYRFVIDTARKYHENPEIFLLEVEYPNDPTLTPKVVQSVLNGELINYNELKTLGDMNLLQLGWVYNVNFTPTLKLIKKEHFLEDIIALLPETEETEQIKKSVLDYVDSRISNSA